MMKDIDVTIKLHTLKRHDKPEGWNFVKPFIWNIFFKADGAGITITDQFLLDGKAIFKYSKGSHGNLGEYPLKKSDLVKIPQEVGEWSTIVCPIKVPYFEDFTSGTAGLISVLLLENNVSHQGSEAGHTALNKSVEKVINELIAGFEPKFIEINDVEGSLEKYFTSRIDQYAIYIEKQVTNAVMRGQGIVSNLWSLLKRDDLVGHEVWKFSHDDLEENDGHILFSQRWNTPLGDWEVFGEAKKTAVHK